MSLHLDKIGNYEETKAFRRVEISMKNPSALKTKKQYCSNLVNGPP